MKSAKTEKAKIKPLKIKSNKSLLQRILGCWELYAFLIPAIVIDIIFKYIPMYGVQLAFKDLIPGKSITESPWVGLKHFIRFFSLPDCGQLIWNTAKVALVSMSTFPLSIILALSLNQVRSEKKKKLVQNVTYMPHLFSTVVVVTMVQVLLSPDSGIVNAVIKMLGHDPILFFGEDKYVVPIYVISGIWQGLGYGAIIYIAALANIDQEQLEAARIDGASRMRIIWHIELPALADTIIMMLILNMGTMFAIGADKMLLLQTDLNLGASEIISTYVYKTGLLNAQFGFSTATNLFNTIVNICCLLIVNGVARKYSENSLF